MKVIVNRDRIAIIIGTCSIPVDYPRPDYVVRQVDIVDFPSIYSGLAAYTTPVIYTEIVFHITNKYVWGRCLEVEYEEDLQHVPDFKFAEEYA